MHSPNLTENNIDRIRELFPNCITEGKDESGKIKYAVDFDLLKQELSGQIVEGSQERYQLNWPGKKEALLTANAPIAKTLRPCVDESVDFVNTRNLFIEGDNLDALKLLQESYLGKVKMINIDPPYNTRKDFIYKDDFALNSNEYLKKSNQIDENSNRMITNTEANGRFHSDWLSMMYPRLKLARNLLLDDGVIFINIDENEFSNLQKLMNEIFGEANFIASFIWQNKKGGGNDAKYCAIEHEYILAYAKNILSLPNFFEEYTEKYSKRYREVDSNGKFYWDTFKRKSGKQYYAITCPDGSILDKDELGNPISWLRSEARFKEDKKIGDVKFEKRNDGWSIMFKQRLPEGKKPRSLILDKGVTSDGSEELLALFDKNIFNNPKPLSLITYLLGVVVNEDDIVLDFFAGSGTTFDSGLHWMLENNKRLNLILVQFPEDLQLNYKSADNNGKSIIQNGIDLLNKFNKPLYLTELTKERLRRAGQKIIKEFERQNIKNNKADIEELNFSEEQEDMSNTNNHSIDIGFRVLKIDTSNMADVFYTPDALKSPEMYGAIENIKFGRTNEDLLFQALLDWNVPLSLSIRKEKIARKDEKGKKTKKSSNDDFEVFFVDENTLVACFDDNISEALVRELANRKPLRVVFKDNGFESDTVKINTEQIFKQLSPTTVVKSI